MGPPNSKFSPGEGGEPGGGITATVSTSPTLTVGVQAEATWSRSSILAKDNKAFSILIVNNDPPGETLSTISVTNPSGTQSSIPFSMQQSGQFHLEIVPPPQFNLQTNLPGGQFTVTTESSPTTSLAASSETSAQPPTGSTATSVTLASSVTDTATTSSSVPKTGISTPSAATPSISVSTSIIYPSTVTEQSGHAQSSESLAVPSSSGTGTYASSSPSSANALSSDSSNKHSVEIILGTICGVVFLFLIAGIFFYIRRRSRDQSGSKISFNRDRMIRRWYSLSDKMGMAPSDQSNSKKFLWSWKEDSDVSSLAPSDSVSQLMHSYSTQKHKTKPLVPSTTLSTLAEQDAAGSKSDSSSISGNHEPEILPSLPTMISIPKITMTPATPTTSILLGESLPRPEL